MRQVLALLALLSFLTIGCQPATNSGGKQKTTAPLPEVTAGDLEVVDGQTVFVAAYSHVNYFIEGKTYLLAATLSIRNTDPDHAISIDSVNYFDSDGKLVQRFLEQPRTVEPMGSTEFFVPQADRRGGSGANFLVRWSSETPVYEPMIEAVMMGTSGTLGIAFTSQGRVYQNRVGG